MSDPAPVTGAHAESAARRPDADAIDSPKAGRAALRGSVVRGGGYVLGVLLSLIAAPLLVRHLGVVDFGRYTTVVSLVALIASLVDAGLNGIALREWSTTSGAERTAGMRNLLGIRIVFTTLGGVAATLFAVVAGYDETLVTGTVLISTGFVLQAVASFLTVPLQGDLRFGWMTLIELGRQFVTVPLIVVLVVAGAGLLPFFVVPIPAALAALVATAVLVRGKTPLRPSFHVRLWWPQLKATFVYAIAIALNAVYLRITIILLALVSTPEQTGYFATSFRVIEVLIAVPTFAIGAAFPILARSGATDRDRFQRAAERILELALTAGVLLSLSVVLVAPFAIEVIGGAEAEPATEVLQ
ncbi:MAG TPA: oligosaccharide flippase family protein, partial [Conexibacter sp.]|nr:oligosaccharide flippase family protein [Conexibacter sp.]